MPPENDDTQVDQTEEQKPQQEKDAEAQFSAGFRKQRGEKPEDVKVDKDEPEDDKDGTDKNETVTAEATATAETPAATPDPWDGVSPIVREHLERLNAIPDRLRNVEGHIGGLNSELKKVTTAAKATAAAKGAPTPTDEEIQAAAASDEEWVKLEEKYGEWAADTRKQFAALEQRLLKKVPTVDVDAIRNDIRKDMPSSDEIASQVEQVIPLYVKHPTWIKEINTPEFQDWSFADGPTKKEYDEYRVLQKTDIAKSQEKLNDIIRRFPTWWSEKGSKMESSTADDAIALMDSYTEFKAAKAATPTPAEKSRSKEKSNQRLSAATTPKGAPVSPQPGVSDEQAFTRGFNKHRKKA